MHHDLWYFVLIWARDSRRADNFEFLLFQRDTM